MEGAGGRWRRRYFFLREPSLNFAYRSHNIMTVGIFFKEIINWGVGFVILWGHNFLHGVL